MMKAIMPWACLLAMANVDVVFADIGLDAYRTGYYKEAAQLFNQSSSHDPVVNYYMGRMRLYGYGELKNNEQALNYFVEAGEKGYVPAQNIMARVQLLQMHNPEKALYWFKKAANLNDVVAQMYCAGAYLYGYGTAPNEDIARRYYIAAAKNGNAIAQKQLAENFIGTRHGANLTLGLLWLNKALAQGNPDAQLLMARLYASGRSVDKDVAKAQGMTKTLATQGYLPAIYQMGQFAEQQGNLNEAKDWFDQGAKLHDEACQLALAQLYLQAKSPLYDSKNGFLLILDAAQQGSVAAQNQLADMYQNGIGADKSDDLAKEWRQKAKQTARDAVEVQRKVLAWLSGGKAKNFAEAGISMSGILSDWHNALTLKENIYNKAPAMERVDRAALFQPQFSMVDPLALGINLYFNQLMQAKAATQVSANFPRYPLIMRVDANKAGQSAQPSATYDYLQANAGQQDDAYYQKLFAQLQPQAILGDAVAQFDVAQMYYYGKGVAKDMEQAIKFYTMAAKQQDLRAEYTVALVYLQGEGVHADYPRALALLKDAAFKGNPYAQYVVATIYEQGYHNANGELVLPADPTQAVAMYDLAAANNFGLAQNRLAQILASAKPGDLSVAELNRRHGLIKSLYQGALRDGVADAALPLAFYQAMDTDKAKQAQAFAVALQAAGEGNQEAQVLLGLLYDRGIGCSPDRHEAMRWYQKAGDNPVSQFVVGTYLSQGQGIEQNAEQGKALLAKAASGAFSYANLNLAILQQQHQEDFLPQLMNARLLGNSQAGLLLADYYLSAANNDDRIKQAREIYQQFAEKGDPTAQYKLAYMMEHALGGGVDMAEAEQWYQDSAATGQPIAQYLLGLFYQLGRLDGKPDYVLSKKWYATAQARYAPAAVALGFLYDTVDDNYQKAQHSYEIAKQLKSAVGEYDLALIYAEGKGQTTDSAKAQAMFEDAANQGYPLAMLSLADQYFYGELGRRDEAAALGWYKKAAAAGNLDAVYQLGLLAETGVGTPLSYADALRYYQQAAVKGDSKAKLALARMYQFGLGVNKDVQHAKELYQELARNGNGYAQYQLALLNKDELHQGAETRRLLQQAEGKGVVPARKTLQKLNAQKMPQVSFIESIPAETSVLFSEDSAELMYFDAVNAWNHGDEPAFRVILGRILGQYPNYLPAKQAYEQLSPGDWG